MYALIGAWNLGSLWSLDLGAWSSSWSLLLLPLGDDQKRADEARQFRSDLFEPAAVSFALLQEKFGHLRIVLKMGFGVLLDFQVHHFFDEFDQRLGIHIRDGPDYTAC